MATIVLEYPKLSISVTAAEPIAGAIGRNFAPLVAARAVTAVDHRFRVESQARGFGLVKDGQVLAAFPDAAELMFFLEEEIERTLLDHLGGWIGLHAGAAVLPNDSALVVVGQPDTGKTTTTFQLVELGLELLCEEVTPVDPETVRAHPFPHTLSFARSYAEQFTALYPVRHGTLAYHGAQIARYVARRVRTTPVRMGTILFPAFDPASVPRLEAMEPGAVLPELLHHCFRPALGDERLYDSVIRLIGRCALVRLHTNGIACTRRLLERLVADAG